MNKKGNMFANIMLGILVLAVVGGGGYYLFGEGTTETTESTTAITTKGELGTLKFSAEDISQDSPSAIATTGYCWDVSSPDALIETRNGKTLSTSAGTSFSPAYRQNTYECTAFDSDFFCDHASGKMVNEGLELRSDCHNYTTSMYVSFYERGTEETTNSLAVPAGTSKSYNKFYIENNNTNRDYPVKALCFGSNSSSSHLADMAISGWNEDEVPESLGGTADDFCFSLTDSILLTEGQGKEFVQPITFEADSTGFGTDELITVTLMEECEYVTKDGVVKTDYFKRETDSEATCGMTDLTTSITLVD